MTAELRPDTAMECAVIVGVQYGSTPLWEVNDNLDELALLAETADAEVVGRVVQERGKPVAATFISRGRISHIRQMVTQGGANLIIFDDDLSPAQTRNLEEQLRSKVIDRSGLILDIFARRARTREARIQVELAQLQYLLPRLTRRWRHLSRQVGGIGTRGPGETQLEIDRRVVQQRIASLKKSLQKIERGRKTRRSHRKNRFKVALIGYTNAGKSTVLNALTGADVFVENRLFATLDPTVRAMRLESGRRILLIDTVGFIRKLPVDLLASFRSTLEESRTADLFVHIVDLSHPHWEGQIERTEEILVELELGQKPQILVFNKVDLVDDSVLIEGLKHQYPEALFVSALRGIRMWELPQRIAGFADARWLRGSRAFHPWESDRLKEFENSVKVIGRTFQDGMISVDYLQQAEDNNRITDQD